MLQKRILFAGLTAISFFAFLNWNCTKLDTTKIGSDLIPAVDNVHTFDTTLDAISTQGLFLDSTYIFRTEDYALGSINNDPLFGLTTANVFLQLKPAFFPYYIGEIKDTLTGAGVGLDSIVLCFKYKGFWGDSTLPIHLDVREVTEPVFRDSVYKDNPTVYQPTYSGASLGAVDVDVRKLGNYVKFTNRRDSVNYQIRIKLNDAWAQALFKRDSIQANSSNNAFYNDSIYRRFYNGLAVLASGGNGLMYVNIADTATKLEMHYRRRNFGRIDTVYSSLRFNSNLIGTYPPGNSVNNIIRNRGGYPVSAPPAGEHYLQTAPGTYVNVSVPGLSGLSNRIIHRAELIVEQIPADPILDGKLTAPNFLYLDLRDTTTDVKWKPLYFDLNTTTVYDPDYKTTAYPFFPGIIDFNYFGGYKRSKKDPFGTDITFYTFNMSRYVQHIVTNHYPNYAMRIYSPYNFRYPQYTPSYINFGNDLAWGRIRIGSGTNPNYKLRMRIIYSKL